MGGSCDCCRSAIVKRMMCGEGGCEDGGDDGGSGGSGGGGGEGDGIYGGGGRQDKDHHNS